MGTQKRRSGYYCRLSIPADMRGLLGKRELVRSLRTRRYELASLRATALESKWRRVLYDVRRVHRFMDEQKLRQLVARYFQESSLMGAEDHLAVDLTDEALKRWSTDLDALLTENARALALNDFSSPSIALAIGSVISEAGPNGIELDPDSLEYRKLCREILQVHSELLHRAKKRAAGEGDGEAWWRPDAPAATVADTHAASPLLSVAIQSYVEQKTCEGAWRPKTEGAIQAALRGLLEIVGDKPVAEISKNDLADYWKVLRQLPPNASKRFPNVPLRELAGREGAQTAAPATVNKNTNFVRILFKWMHRRDYIRANPSVVLGRVRVGNAQDQRQAFTDADLRLIFGPNYAAETKGHPARYWIPLVLAYTGARLEEVAQLHRSDIRQEAGVWCMDINTQGEDKRLKTAQSRRLVPLHSDLLAKGFLKYVEGVPDGHLWPVLRKRESGYGDAVSKWFNRRLKQLSFPVQRKVLHSLRHTVITRLKDADVQSHTISELVGHKVESITTGRYGKRLNVERLQQAVELLQLPI